MRFQTTPNAQSTPNATRTTWPDAVAYREAIQNPEAVLGDRELAAADVVHDRLGLPVAYTGRFAVVFRLRDRHGHDWAVRCFTQPDHSGERRRRYRAIHSRLEQLGAAGPFVSFRFVEKGIRVAGQWHPTVAMRWAKGETLGKFIESNLDSPAALRRLADALEALLNQLEDAGIAHGDWQHDNILVSENGDLTLVDYDGLFVPELSGLASPEIGHGNYQHPNRTAGDYFGIGLDRFACRVITTALRALAHAPLLWRDFSGDGESILFQRADLADPSRSRIFAAIRAVAELNDDDELAAALDRLQSACLAEPEPLTLPPIPAEVLAAAAGERDPNAAVGEKWWLAPDAVIESTAAPSPKTSAAVVQPGVAALGKRSFLDELNSPANLQAERLALRSARIAVVLLVLAIATLVLTLRFGGKIFPFPLLFFFVSGLRGLGTLPRRRLYQELEARLEACYQYAEALATAVAEQRADLNFATRATTPDEYVRVTLQTIPIRHAPSGWAVHPLQMAGVRTAADLRGRTEIPGISDAELIRLQSWRHDLERDAAERWREMSRSSATAEQEIARLEAEKQACYDEIARLSTEKARWPERSHFSYLVRAFFADEP